MPFTRLPVATGLVAGLTLLAPVAAQTPPALPDLLNRAAAYHASYGSRVSGATLEELYQLLDVSGGTMRNSIRISSDVVFVNLNNQITALRDPYAVDAQPVRPHEPRITALLAAPATPTVRDWITASDYPAESSWRFTLDIILKVSEPTTALQFVSAEHQPKVVFKVDGQKKMNGVQVIALRFQEPVRQDRDYVLKTRGHARASGRIWVDVATGAVHQTELWVESDTEQANVTVKYAPNAALNLILPTETTETYEERINPAGPREMGLGYDPSLAASRLEFQARAYYSKAAHSPIDLTKINK